jgi:hypothetical protein
MKNYKIYLYTKFVGVPQRQRNYPVRKHRSLFEQGDYNKYISELFDEHRIETRLRFFKELTLKSILNQTYKNFEWVIFISDLLPQKYKDYIQSVKNTDNRIKLIEVTEIKRDNKYLQTLHQPEEETYISCRLDDDDALCSDYFEILNKQFNEDKTIQVLGSVDYYMVMYDDKDEKFLFSTNIGKNKFMISAGLSCVNQHIYAIGSHSQIIREDKYRWKIINKKFSAIQSAGPHTFTERTPCPKSTIRPFDMSLYLAN